jgi:hypothetical protein
MNMTNTVTMDSTKTGVLTAISPRYGTRKGGETITFTGTNLSPTASYYNI